MLDSSMVVKFYKLHFLHKNIFGLSKVPNDISNFPSFIDSFDMGVISHEVLFCNLAKIKQGTLAKLQSCENYYIMLEFQS